MPYRQLLLTIPMLFLLVACSTAQAAAPPPTLTQQEVRGQAKFDSSCSRCHSTLEGLVVVGPSLYGIATRGAERIEGVDIETYIRESILDPGAYTVEGFPEDAMPATFGEELSKEDIDALVAYLLTL
jgi:mono/diheme cytochrome c family protein